MMIMMMMASSETMKKRPPKEGLTLLPCFYFVELPLAVSSLFSLYVLQQGAALHPARVGFRCLDPLLSKPYVDEGDELVPLLMLLSLAFAAPSASIMLVEGILSCLQTLNNLGKFNCNIFLRRTVHFVGVHVFGLCLTALITDIIQLVTGSHAPFFLTVCRPNYTLAGGSCDRDSYITTDICSGHDHHAITSARKTFPSQHATLSAFAAVYISMYFNATLSDCSKLLKPLLVFLFSISAALIGLTQITQHRSHPIDVYAGFLIGAFIAVYLALHAVANFESSEGCAVAHPSTPPKEDPLRALTERGHDSIYHKGPASASESQEELPAAVPTGEPVAARGPMGKDTMLTFSNSLPRSSTLVNEEPPEDELSAEPRMREMQTLDPLLSEWKQRSLELRAKQEGHGEDGDMVPGLPGRKSLPFPGGGRAITTPKPPQIQETGPPPVSPKSAVTRAKWLAIRETSSANQPHLLQVVSLSRQQTLFKSEVRTPDSVRCPHPEDMGQPPAGEVAPLHSLVHPNLSHSFLSGQLSPFSGDDNPPAPSSQVQALHPPLAEPSLQARHREVIMRRMMENIRETCLENGFQNKSLF